VKKTAIIFTTTHTNTLGNANRLEIIKYLSRKFQATIYTNQEKFIKERFLECQVIELVNPNKLNFPILSDILYWKHIANKINKVSFDFVFMIYSTSPVTFWLKLPVFQYVHQYGLRTDNKGHIFQKIRKMIFKPLHNWLILRGLKRSQINFVVSQLIIDNFKKKGFTNLELTPHGIDVRKYQNPHLTNDHNYLKELREKDYFLVTYIGWVKENRGFKLMLNSLQEAVMLDKKVVLIIAGADKNINKRIEDFKKGKNLEDHIVNLGIVDISLIPGILYYSNVCLSFLGDIPAYHISPPQKIVEYFAAGKPVICNKIETHELLVRHKKNGFILNDNSTEIAENIIKLKNDRILYNSMCLNAIETASEYDLNLVYGKMVQKITKVLNEY